MDKSGRFAIFSSSSFGGRNGCRDCRKFGVNKGIVNRIFSFFRFYRWVTLWLFCFISSYALAEWDENDTRTLNEILYAVEQIENDEDTRFSLLENMLEQDGNSVGFNANRIYNYVYRTFNALGYSYGSSARHLSDDMADVNTNLVDIHDNITGLYDGLTSLESIYARLGEILDALDGNTGGSGGEIPSDIATETTLSSFKGKYEELANQFLNSWGYAGGSGGTLKESLSYFFPKSNTSNRYTVYAITPTLDLGDTSPFPVPGGTGGSWKPFTVPMFGSSIRQFQNNFMEDFGFILGENLYGLSSIQQENAKKQAWNDWYAHTNLISTLNVLSRPPDNYIDKSSDIGSLNDENGEMSITYNDAEGGSPPTPELIDTKIVYTNDFAQLETKAEEVEDIFKDINYSKMKEIYKVPQGIENQGYRDYSQIETIPDYQIQYGNDKNFSFVFGASHRQIYNSILSPSLLNKLRGVFSKLWFFLSVYFNFVLFKIFGKVND